MFANRRLRFINTFFLIEKSFRYRNLIGKWHCYERRVITCIKFRCFIIEHDIYAAIIYAVFLIRRYSRKRRSYFNIAAYIPYFFITVTACDSLVNSLVYTGERIDIIAEHIDYAYIITRIQI